MIDSRRRWMLSPIAASSLVVVVGIAVLDWLTPAGVVVGILLTVPVVLSSMSDEPRHVWLVGTAAIAGFVAAAALGRGPISPAEVWVPNRILAALALPASGALALVLQRRRREAGLAAEASQRASDLNRLLLSLLAHDLRAPLAVAVQGLDYVQATSAEEPLDFDLVEDLRTRLRRNLGAIDGILALARAEPVGPTAPEPIRSGAELARELETEALAFEREAAARDMELVVRIEGQDERYAADSLVLRQAIAILVDNAVRHALAGRISVIGRIAGEGIQLDVADQGPGLGVGRNTTEGGSGLGLALCRAMVDRAGGELRVTRDGASGTTFTLRLPLRQIRNT